MNTTEMTKAMVMVEETILFKDYELLESVLNSLKNVIKTAVDNKYNFDKKFMLVIVKYQQHDNGYKVFINDLETITASFKEAVQYVGRTEDLNFQEEYCLLNFEKYDDIKKFTTKYIEYHHHEEYDNICKVFNRIKIEDQLISLIKEMRKFNLISDEDNKNISIIIDKYNNR